MREVTAVLYDYSINLLHTKPVTHVSLSIYGWSSSPSLFVSLNASSLSLSLSS